MWINGTAAVNISGTDIIVTVKINVATNIVKTIHANATVNIITYVNGTDNVGLTANKWKTTIYSKS